MKMKLFLFLAIFSVLFVDAHADDRRLTLPPYLVRFEDRGVVITECVPEDDFRSLLALVRGLGEVHQPGTRIFFARDGQESELGRLDDVVQDTAIFVVWETLNQRALA